MNRPPLISVVIPAYNHEAYVETAIRSVIEQDYPRIELVVIDDMSKDRTWDVICTLEEECRDRVERVVMSRNESNSGTCDTLNKLRKTASGDFFLPMASDDKLLPGALTRLIAPMIMDVDIGVVLGQNKIMDGDGRICFWDEERNNVYYEGKARWRSFNEYLQDVTGVCQFGPEFGMYRSLVKANHIANGYLIRKEMLDAILPFTKEAPLEDHWLHLQLSKRTRYKAVGDDTFVYRWHANNTIRQTERMRRFWRATFLWEARYTEKLGREWFSSFIGVVGMRKRVLSIAGTIMCDKAKGRLYKWYVFRFCGVEFFVGRRLEGVGCRMDVQDMGIARGEESGTRKKSGVKVPRWVCARSDCHMKSDILSNFRD